MSQPGASAPARTYVGYAGVLAFVVLSGLAVTAGLWKVLTIGWVAFAAMAGAAIPGRRAAASKHAGRLVWGYGLAAGAMVTSAAVFLLPQAFGFDPKVGGFGVASGILLGFASHTIGHRLAHYDLPFDATTAHLTAHSLTAGIIIGVVYSTLPELGLVLGLAIVSHKGPAGYAAARRLAANDKATSIILLPAAGVGITAILSGLVSLPASAQLNAAVFGFAAGIFLHIAMDFLPRCEVGGEVGEVAKLTDDAHALLDRLRVHAVVSTSFGALAVLGAWLAVA